MVLKPKNWDKFQHYKDRCPPWIKLHRDILNDRMFANLPIASKALAPLLWLLASESKDGSFDAATEELAFRLHFASKDIEAGLKPLIDKGFFVDASTMLAPCYQVAIPETETEGETDILIDRFDDFYKVYPKKVAKEQAVKAWRKIKPNDELFDKIIKAIKSQGLYDRDKQFVPNPATWLNGKRWEDEVASKQNDFDMMLRRAK